MYKEEGRILSELEKARLDEPSRVEELEATLQGHRDSMHPGYSFTGDIPKPRADEGLCESLPLLSSVTKRILFINHNTPIKAGKQVSTLLV